MRLAVRRYRTEKSVSRELWPFEAPPMCPRPTPGENSPAYTRKKRVEWLARYRFIYLTNSTNSRVRSTRLLHTKSPFSRFFGCRRQKNKNIVVSARGRRTSQAPTLRVLGCVNARKYDFKSSSLYSQSNAAVEGNDDAAAEGDDDDEEDAANEADANRLLDEGTTESANSLALVAATSTTKPRKRKAESKHNTLETRVFLFLHMPERGVEFETFLDETTDEYIRAQAGVILCSDSSHMASASGKPARACSGRVRRRRCHVRRI